MLRENAKKAAGEQSSAMSPTLAWPWVREIFLTADVLERPRMPQAPVPRELAGIRLRCATIYCSACAKSSLRRKNQGHQAIADCCAATDFFDCSIGGTPRAEPMRRAWHSGLGRADSPAHARTCVRSARIGSEAKALRGAGSHGAPDRRALPGFGGDRRSRGTAKTGCHPRLHSTSNDCSSTGSVTLSVPAMPAPFGPPWISQ